MGLRNALLLTLLAASPALADDEEIIVTRSDLAELKRGQAVTGSEVISVQDGNEVRFTVKRGSSIVIRVCRGKFEGTISECLSAEPTASRPSDVEHSAGGTRGVDDPPSN